jgi:hypothetical protein
MRAPASEAAQAEVVRYCPKSDHIADMERASVPERGSNAGPAKPRLEFIALRAHNGSVCGVADMPLTGPIPEGRPFFCPHCGALYSVTDAPRPKGDNTTAKCVVCTRTMVEWASTEGRVYKLIHRPEDA